MINVLFVCLGNICRSPSAEAVMNHKIKSHSLESFIKCDSAGTSGYHIGEKADERMRRHAIQRGYSLESLARKFAYSDFERFDYILAMDMSNYKDIKAFDRNSQYGHKIFLMTDFCRSIQADEVPDPYYGGARGFEHVLDILEDACSGLLDRIKSEHGLK